MSATKVTLSIGASDTEIQNAPREILNAVSELLYYRIEHYSQDGSKSYSDAGMFNWKTMSFPSGFVRDVVNLLVKKLGYSNDTLTIIRAAHNKPAGPAVRDCVVDNYGYSADRDYQYRTVDELEKRYGMIAHVATGGGKCFRPDTEVIKLDGTTAEVKDLQVGDQILGDDDTPRTVQAVTHGSSDMYRVTPVKGEPWVCNDKHILSLVSNTDFSKDLTKGQKIEVGIDEYLKFSNTRKRVLKQYSVGFDGWKENEKWEFSPYLVGVWLGDGTTSATNFCICSKDLAILDRLKSELSEFQVVEKDFERWKTAYFSKGRSLPNELRTFLKKFGLGKRKTLPEAFIVGSKQQRLQLLAGLLDTDGHLGENRFSITQKQLDVAKSIVKLARSLGFRAKMIEVVTDGALYHRVYISGGDLSQIPTLVARKQAQAFKQKINPLWTGFSVENIGHGDYVGIMVDGNERFLLNDFTVVHNTRIAKLIYARFQRPTIFLTTRQVLMYQCKEDIENTMGIKCGIIGDGHPIEFSDGFTVAMVQSIAAWSKVLNLNHEIKLAIQADSKTVTSRVKRAKTQIEKMNLDKAAAAATLKQATEKITGSMRSTKQLTDEVTAAVNAHNQRAHQVVRDLARYEVVISEEAHESGGDSYYRVMRMMKNAMWRCALTGSPLMSEEMESNLRLIALNGNIGIHISEEELINKGILSKPYFKFVKMPREGAFGFAFEKWPKCYVEGIVENQLRNQYALRYIALAYQYRLPCLVLIQRVSHGKWLKKAIKQYIGIDADFISGESSHKERKAALDKVSRECGVLIGSTILDVGVDVPMMGMLINLGGYKDEAGTRQRFGRVLRRKPINISFIVDFLDAHNNTLNSHSHKRMSIVKTTPGFSNGIVPDGQDLPWDQFFTLDPQRVALMPQSYKVN